VFNIFVILRIIFYITVFVYVKNCWGKLQTKKIYSMCIIAAAGDLVSFSKLRAHYRTEYREEVSLFTPASRPTCLNILYQAAAPTNTQVSSL
jgi:hypothetical protein